MLRGRNAPADHATADMQLMTINAHSDKGDKTPLSMLAPSKNLPNADFICVYSVARSG